MPKTKAINADESDEIIGGIVVIVIAIIIMIVIVHACTSHDEEHRQFEKFKATAAPAQKYDRAMEIIRENTNLKTAVELLEISAHQNHVPSQIQLAKLLLSGKGYLRPDKDAGIFYLTEATLQGSREAEKFLETYRDTYRILYQSANEK